MDKPKYYSKADTVYREPEVRGNKTTIGFPACIAADGVEAADIAKLLDLGERYESLEKAARVLADDVSKDDAAGHGDQIAAVYAALGGPQ